MGFIYKITNDINNKVYVGKTLHSSIEERFKEHINDSKRKRCSKRPLYNAINKYGEEHFKIELIGEYPDNELNQMEIYWIGYYNGYTEGYNATTGGDGKQLFDHEAITARLKEFPYPIQVTQEFNCSPDLIRELCRKNKILIKNYATDNKKRPVIQYTKSYEFLNRFDSIIEAGNWCYQNNYCTNKSRCGRAQHIAEAASGRRKQAYDFYWFYEE